MKEYWHGMRKVEIAREQYLQQFYPKSERMKQIEDEEMNELVKIIKERLSK